MVTGGVNIDNIDSWIKAGVDAVGIGGELNKLGEWMKWFLLTVITLIIISQVSHMFLTYGG